MGTHHVIEEPFVTTYWFFLLFFLKNIDCKEGCWYREIEREQLAGTQGEMNAEATSTQLVQLIILFISRKIFLIVQVKIQYSGHIFGKMS